MLPHQKTFSKHLIGNKKTDNPEKSSFMQCDLYFILTGRTLSLWNHFTNKEASIKEAHLEHKKDKLILMSSLSFCASKSSIKEVQNGFFSRFSQN